MIDFWKSLVEHILGWPVMAFFLGLLFRKPLRDLVGRINYIKAPGFDFSAPQSPASAQIETKPLPTDALNGEIGSTTPDTAGIATGAATGVGAIVEQKLEAVRNFAKGIPMVEESVEAIKGQLAALNLPLDSPETGDILVRHLAATQLMLRCERTHRLIFGSQLVALHMMNNAGPQPDEALAPIYESARAKEPQFYGSYTFEAWMQFLIKEGTVIKTDQGANAITVYGQNYLEYIGAFAPGPKPH